MPCTPPTISFFNNHTICNRITTLPERYICYAEKHEITNTEFIQAAQAYYTDCVFRVPLIVSRNDINDIIQSFLSSHKNDPQLGVFKIFINETTQHNQDITFEIIETIIKSTIIKYSLELLLGLMGISSSSAEFYDISFYKAKINLIVIETGNTVTHTNDKLTAIIALRNNLNNVVRYFDMGDLLP